MGCAAPAGGTVSGWLTKTYMDAGGSLSIRRLIASRTRAMLKLLNYCFISSTNREPCFDV
jgi:hypothetical protein